MSFQFAKQHRWVKKSWDDAHAELEAPFNEFVHSDEFTQDHAEFEFDAVIDRPVRYALATDAAVSDDSDEEADLSFSRYV